MGQAVDNCWIDRLVWERFDWTRATMALGAGGTLDDQYIDIIAYGLAFSGYPLGGDELPLDEELLEAMNLVPLR